MENRAKKDIYGLFFVNIYWNIYTSENIHKILSIYTKDLNISAY